MRPHLTRSLSVHLRATEDHSQLPFHPECPLCRRDRLAGTLASDELVSRRTQAAIAAGLFALSTAGAPAAFGSPRDEIIEGTEEIVSDRELDFELDGDGDQLSDVTSPPPGVPALVADDDESGPVEQDPVADVGEPSDDGDADHDAATEPEPVVSKPSPSTAAPAPMRVADPAEATTQAADPGPKPEGGRTRRTVRQQSRAVSAPEKGSGPSTTRNEVSVAPAAVRVAPVQTVAEPASAAVTAAEPESAPVTVRVVARTSTEQAAKGKRFHTVKQGESLWSIAADVVGEDAGSARIAREVQRLWELNDERIGTGQPDLLFAGTRLRLR